MKIAARWKDVFKEPVDRVLAAGIYTLFFIYFYFITQKLVLSLLFALWGLVLLPQLKKGRKREREKRLLLEFGDFLYGFTNHVITGKAMENSVRKGGEDISAIYGESSLLKDHLDEIGSKFDLGIGLDAGFIELGKSYGSMAIETFGEMLGVARKKGGDLITILKRTGEVLTEQLAMEREIEILLAKQNLEIKILRGMPFFLILLLKFIYPEMISLLTESLLGILIFTGAGGLMAAAYFYSKKLMEVIW